MTTAAHPRDKWIPWYFVIFFVGLAIVDGIFVTIATSTHRGVVTEQAYEKGLNYNDTLAALEAQEQLGWVTDIAYENGLLIARLHNAEEQALTGADVTVHLARVTQDGFDRSITMQPAGDGYYTAEVAFPMPGLWHATLEVLWNQQHYHKRERLIIP